jgi:hypothetical protein
MSNELSAAVTTLQRKLDEQLQAVSETKKVINMLLKSMGKPPQYADVGESSGIIRADQFYGKGFATAASEYLELRKQACQPDDILRGMIEGGFDFDVLGWKESDRLRALAVSLAKNVAKFHRLKNGSFGLRSWYDDDFLKKAGRQKTDAAAAAAAAEDEKIDPGKEEQEAADNFIPKVGDWIQWEPGGVMQFKEPEQIARMSDDGAFAFIATSPTGMPVDELVLRPIPRRTRRISAK